MPSPSMNKMVELADLVSQVNTYESKLLPLTDAQLRQKTVEFKEILKNNSQEFAQELDNLQQAMLLVAMPEEKEKLKENNEFIKKNG